MSESDSIEGMTEQAGQAMTHPTAVRQEAIERVTPKERLFAHEYGVDLNATQAAIRAGYAPRSADVTAARLLGKASVRQLVESIERKRLAKADITAERVLNEVAAIAFASPRDVAKWGPWGITLVDSEQLTAEAAAAIESVQIDQKWDILAPGNEETATVFAENKQKFKMHSKTTALQMLMRHLGIAGDTPAGNTYNDNRTQVIDLSGLTDDQLRARIAAARAITGG